MPDDDFGYTPWGRDWVRLAQPLRQTLPNPALPRARKLARLGGVQVTIDGRVVRGVVERGRGTSVACIAVAPMSQETIADIAGRLCGARALLTEDVHRAVTEMGHSPAPVLESVDCSCSDDTGRCVHVLAVFYEMARRVDDDPRISLDVQEFCQVSPDVTRAPTAALPQRWIALNVLNPADYFAVPR
ncbi:SWIM zinc finger family protein [Lentzea californiensis]|uniref:SWIM zinc finger family protein n=1 Tax=Lentzea californiensis TaxID=438851 RepID=UPI00216642B1|nr:SWIM zinc finger family protein [Lentzea californiensis]MCR3752118.1 SWIM zinc finger protein [Lentzea californiensis]